ncbi:MAG: hypothetical protein RL190_1924, partial [Actinomycetota bacterium]
ADLRLDGRLRRGRRVDRDAGAKPVFRSQKTLAQFSLGG